MDLSRRIIYHEPWEVAIGTLERDKSLKPDIDLNHLVYFASRFAERFHIIAAVLADPTHTWTYKLATLITKSEIQRASNELEYLIAHAHTSPPFAWRTDLLSSCIHMDTLLRRLSKKKTFAIYNQATNGLDSILQSDYMETLRADILNTFTSAIRNVIDLLRDLRA